MADENSASDRPLQFFSSLHLPDAALRQTFPTGISHFIILCLFL